eukprot:115872-Pyramimonas_sp.AAC.1
MLSAVWRKDGGAAVRCGLPGLDLSKQFGPEAGGQGPKEPCRRQECASSRCVSLPAADIATTTR